MRLYYYFIFVIYALGIPLSGHAQLKIQTGEYFMTGVSLKKLNVCVEDHSVWVLTQDGKVYFKKTNDSDFSIYPLTALLTITALSGFNANEMYFVSDNKILLIKDGVISILQLSFPGVTRINDVSVVYGKNNSTSANPGLNHKDYLAIATNKSFFYAIRESTIATLEHQYFNTPYVAEPDCEFSYTGFKALDLRYISPSSYCVDVDRLTENIHLGYSQMSYIQDKNGYNKVNCTVFARNFYFPFLGSSDYTSKLNVWGSSNGLFIKNVATCVSTITNQRLNDIYVNDIEEIYALTPIYKQDYLIAASKSGIYYTPESIFNKQLSDPNFAKFLKLNDFPTKNVTAIASETDYLGFFSHGQDKYYSLCERIVWAATESGIHKLYLSLDQDFFNTYKWADFNYSKAPSNNNFEEPEFHVCENENVTITAAIPSTFSNQILIKWYKDDLEIPLSIGKLQMTFSASGVYRVKVTSLCENITVTSNRITVKNNPGPEITFTPPPNVNICNSQPYLMETKNVSNYSYQWYKDEVKIASATQFRYSATTTGKYRVEVSNNTCPSILSSASVNLNFITMPIPSITKDKTGYCIGETATLSINNSQGLQTKWYFNGTEISSSANQDKITIEQTGNYRVEFISTDCVNSSIDYPITFNQLPTANISRSNNKTLCYGESVELTANDIPGATYLWSTGEKTKNIVVTNAGKYSLTITNASNCSSTSNEIEVFVNEELRFQNPVISSIKNDYCIDEVATLKVENTNGLKTKWYMNGVGLPAFDNKNQLTTNTAGKYEVELINSLNCSKSSAEFPITFNDKLVVIINSSVNKTICEGESVKLSAGIFPNARYLWSTGEKTETINATSSGKYSVQVFSEFNCTSTSDEIEIKVNPLPILSNNEQIKICVILKDQAILKAEPGFLYYNWNGKSGINPELIVKQPGVYTVVVEDINGCKASKTFEVIPYCKEIIAPNAFSPNGDGINDLWKVGGLENEPNSSIQIFNRLGTLVFDGRGNNPVWDGNINNSRAPIGVYYYVITTFLVPQTVKGIVTLIR